MKNGPLRISARETLIPGIVSLLLMTGLLILLTITGYLFNSNTDDHITAAAKEAFALKSDLKGDEFQVHSQDGAVTLTGTVGEEPHLSLVAETVACLPGVKRVDNRLEVRTHSVMSAPGPYNLTK
ncbi:MAG TPA: BON domain-containing protein [Patescibacteria group bacterium]|nr:BON domain-containing protein [Patescibacteria group bacterium]